MTEARELIATTCIEGKTEPVGQLHAAAIIAVLLHAGYRIIGPGKLDNETVERCAQLASAYIHIARANMRTADNVAEAIRVLSDTP